MAHDGARWLAARKNHPMAHVKDKNSPFNHAKGAPQLIRAPLVGHGLVVGGWPMMVRDGCGRAKIIQMAHVKDKNSPFNHAKGAPQLIRAPLV
jgi:hypothetical protein